LSSTLKLDIMFSKEIEVVYDLFTKGSRVTTDSRDIKPNDIFIALKGEQHDGNMFAIDALGKGAALSVVDNELYKEKTNCLWVNNSLHFLQSLAKHHRDHLSIPIIGLTGSNGKTTTKELISKVLSSKYPVYATQGNLNNHIGVPLSILSINTNHEVAVIEMGANHIGEIEFLCNIAQPNLGIITNIGKAHLEGFGSVDGVIKAKTELYNFLKNTNGTAFYNSDNELLCAQIEKFKLTNRSIAFGNNMLGSRIVDVLPPYLSVEMYDGKDKIVINTNLTGAYNVENVLAAWSIGLHFQIKPQQIKESLESYAPNNSRSQVVEKGSNTIILDAYNANPSSMGVALESFASLETSKQKVVILGEMLELGEFTVTEHSRIAEMACSSNFSRVILVGFPDLHRLASEKMHQFRSAAECIDYLKQEPIMGSLVLLKGSRGARMERVLDFL
jgi:UDP-N-acetylmuramoyl-tripeptide--D-alanyl-D-alanine ligase